MRYAQFSNQLLIFLEFNDFLFMNLGNIIVTQMFVSNVKTWYCETSLFFDVKSILFFFLVKFRIRRFQLIVIFSARSRVRMT
jgi:hypothetical protein